MQGNLNQFYQISNQHVKCATRGKLTLDHLYSTHRDAYKALPRPTFGKSDHNFILLIPAYKQQLKQEAPVKQMLSYRTVLLAQTGICYGIPPMAFSEYTTPVIGFINKCIEDVVPTVTVRTY
jgi:hypothetical protein